MPNSRIPKKGTKGAAKNYISRQQAIKKLQCSLADFRRLCILKGIYPREPRNKKKANKGSTAPTSLYYAKDIQYLLHEPVLNKLREHKAFAKKLSKALGRGEYGLAKNLNENKPEYRLDHIIKERYPTFQDSLRDLDDALCLIVLFAHLPTNPIVPAEVISNCAKLYAEWQLYVLRTRSLRKVFLSIKGIYYQAQIRGVPITWLVPYQFTQHVPSDIDFRVMNTFLELYQTLLGFAFFKLYTDANLIYPPRIDLQQEEAGAGIGAHLLQEANAALLGQVQPVTATGQKISARQVKQQIKSIAAPAAEAEPAADSDATEGQALVRIEDVDSEDDPSKLFDSYYFYLSREVTRPFLEFVIRSFGGKVGWDATLGAGSPYTDKDPRITHHIVDRPLPTDPEALAAVIEARNAYPGRRAFVQPQWVVDSVNTVTIKPTGPYEPGAVLPPHLSPFVDDRQIAKQGGYVPKEAGVLELEQAEEEESSEEEEEEEEEDEAADVISEEEDDPEEFAKQTAPAKKSKLKDYPPALLAAALDPSSKALKHAAELEAETRNVSHEAFEKELQAAIKAVKKQRGQKRSAVQEADKEEEELADIMVTGKKRKMLNNYQRRKEAQQAQTEHLQRKRKALAKATKA